MWAYFKSNKLLLNIGNYESIRSCIYISDNQKIVKPALVFSRPHKIQHTYILFEQDGARDSAFYYIQESIIANKPFIEIYGDIKSVQYLSNNLLEEGLL